MEAQQFDVQAIDSLIVQLRTNIHRTDMKTQFIKYYSMIKSKIPITGDIKQTKTQNQLLLEYLLQQKTEYQGYQAVKTICLDSLQNNTVKYHSFLVRRNLDDNIKSLIMFIDYQADSPIFVPSIMKVTDLPNSTKSESFLQTPMELRPGYQKENPIISEKQSQNTIGSNKQECLPVQNIQKQQNAPYEEFQDLKQQQYALQSENNQINTQNYLISPNQSLQNQKQQSPLHITKSRDYNIQQQYSPQHVLTNEPLTNSVLLDKVEQSNARRRSIEATGLDEVERRLSVLKQQYTQKMNQDANKKLRDLQSNELENHFTEILRPGEPQVGAPAPAVTGIIEDLNDMLERLSTPGPEKQQVFRSRVIADTISDTLNPVYKLQNNIYVNNRPSQTSYLSNEIKFQSTPKMNSSSDHQMPFPDYSQLNKDEKCDEQANQNNQSQQMNTINDPYSPYGPGGSLENLGSHKQSYQQLYEVNNRQQNFETKLLTQKQEEPYCNTQMDELRRSLAALDASLNASLTEVSNFHQNAPHEKVNNELVERSVKHTSYHNIQSPQAIQIQQQNFFLKKESICKENDELMTQKQHLSSEQLNLQNVVQQNSLPSIQSSNQISNHKISPQSGVINMYQNPTFCGKSHEFLKMLENASDQTNIVENMKENTYIPQQPSSNWKLQDQSNQIHDDINYILNSSKTSFQSSQKTSNINSNKLSSSNCTTQILVLKTKQDRLKSLKQQLQEKLETNKIKQAIYVQHQKPLIQRKIFYLSNLLNKFKQMSIMYQRLYLKTQLLISRMQISFQDILNKYPQIKQYYLSGKNIYQSLYGKISEICIQTFRKLKLLQKLKQREIKDLQFIQKECLSQERESLQNKIQEITKQKSDLESKSFNTKITDLLASKTENFLTNRENQMSIDLITSKLLSNNLPSTASPSRSAEFKGPQISQQVQYEKTVYSSPQTKFSVNVPESNGIAQQLIEKQKSIEDRFIKLQSTKQMVKRLEQLNNMVIHCQNLKQRLQIFEESFRGFSDRLKSGIKSLYKLDNRKLSQPLLYLSYFKQHHNFTIRLLLLNFKKQHLLESELKFAKLRMLARQRKMLLQMRHHKRLIQILKQIHLSKNMQNQVAK